jgi:hypothetical protein
VERCKIHVLTHGLHYASAVFEGERAYGGEIFKLTEHTERLHTSADILGFKIPYSVAEIDQACVELLARQGFEDAYVRPIAWRGSEMMGVSAQANRRSRGAPPFSRGLSASIDSNSARKLPSPKPSSPLRWMNSKKIGPITVLEKICSRIFVSPPPTRLRRRSGCRASSSGRSARHGHARGRGLS